MRIRTRLVGLLATVTLLAILIGLPAVLLALGANPIPHTLPNPDAIRSALTTPDDGTLALSAVKVAGWLAWAALAVSVLLELVSRARGLKAPKVPGLSLPQGMARQLVAAAALLFIMAPTTSTTAAATPHDVSTPAATAATTTPTNAAAQKAAAAVSTIPTTVVGVRGTGPDRYHVQPGDTLSRIAERELGDANRWPEIAALNPQVTEHPNLIYPGTDLTLPPVTPQASHPYEVQPGDTLSGIAERELGDASKYPLIFLASRDTVQPGGVRLTDPNRIDVGQTLTIPGAPTLTAPLGGSSLAAEARSTASDPTPAVPLPVTHRPGIDDLLPPAVAQAPVLVPAGARQHATATGAEGPAETATATPWMLAGLTGGGALLGGALLTMLRRRRRAQFRHRRPGRTIAGPDPLLGPVEKTVTVIGALTAPTVAHMDQVLRRLAAAAAQSGDPMPVLAAVELTATDLVLHLAEPAALPTPWAGSDDGYIWRLRADAALDLIGPEVLDQPAPYPLLVTIGVGEQDQMWLLNFEDLDVTITGDATYGQDFARYVVAEVACNPWSAGVNVTCLGVAAELSPINPERICVHDSEEDPPAVVAELLADAIGTVDRANDGGTDACTARSHQHGADAWPARLLLVDGALTSPALEQLLDLVREQAGRTATAVVLAGAGRQTVGTVLHVTAQGRVSLPQVGLDLVAVGLTSDEAIGCATLLAHSETTDEAPVPVDVDATVGWRSVSDEAGALRIEHTLPRGEPGQGPGSDTSSLLDQDDDTYLRAGATTREDLQAVAPRVDLQVRRTVEEADPTLDGDLAMWLRQDCPLPKLHLLGPVRATTRGTPLAKRKPYFTELLAFIALRPLGATPGEVADAFNISGSKARDYALTVRHWLGRNPRTNDYHLPDARLAPAADIRGVPVYQVCDLLVDADLFRRLRVRGQARGGPDGIADLRAALGLVQGRPFDYPIQREGGGGWSWLIDGDRLDEYLTVAIVDVAHTVVTHDLAAGDVAAARLAVEIAVMAAPFEEIPRLDLTAVADAQGRHTEARRIIRDGVCNRTDDESAPPELPTRTEQILDTHRKWTDSRAS